MISRTFPHPGLPADTIKYQYPNNSTRNPSYFYSTQSNDSLIFYEYDNKPNPYQFVFPSIQPENNLTKVNGSTVNSYDYNSQGYWTARGYTNGASTDRITYNCK